MDKNRKLGLALIAAGCVLAAFCGMGLYYVNHQNVAPAMVSATAVPTEWPRRAISPMHQV